MKMLFPFDNPYWRLRYGPDWRYRTARDFLGGDGHPRVADRLLKDVARYLRHRDLGATHVAAARRAFPAIAKAFELQHQTSLVDNLRLMLLGELDEAEILARTGVVAEELRLWQGIFFDVDLQHDPLGWHVNHIVHRELDAGNIWLANRLHLARCGGPHAARRLLDGPGMVPSDPGEYARYVRTEAQIASGGLFLSRPQSRQEMENMMQLALKLMLATKREKLAENQHKIQEAKDKLRVLLAELKVEAAAAKAAAQAAAKAQAQAEKEARDRELENSRREQQVARESRLQAQRQARIEQSPLQQLEWATSEVPGSSPIARAVVAPGNSASSASPRPAKRPPAPISSTTAALGRAIAGAVDAQPPVPEPASSLAP